MRNKLIELLSENFVEFCNVQIIAGNAKISAVTIDAEKFADHLIANGVTIQRWIPASERLPDTTDDVLCWYEYFRFGEYQRMFQTHGVGFCVSGMWGGEVANGYKARVLYWMPLPEPPREEV